MYNRQFQVYNRQFAVYNRQFKVSKFKNKNIYLALIRFRGVLKCKIWKEYKINVIGSSQM